MVFEVIRGHLTPKLGVFGVIWAQNSKNFKPRQIIHQNEAFGSVIWFRDLVLGKYVFNTFTVLLRGSKIITLLKTLVKDQDAKLERFGLKEGCFHVEMRVPENLDDVVLSETKFIYNVPLNLGVILTEKGPKQGSEKRRPSRAIFMAYFRSSDEILIEQNWNHFRLNPLVPTAALVARLPF